MAKSHINAWREILARIFDGLEVVQNITPAWLVNPTTKRQLKLDLFYPQIGLAIRFAGLRGTQQRGRQSLAEKAQQGARDVARDQVSEKHGVSLAILDIMGGELHDLFEALELALSRATRRLQADEALSAIQKRTYLAHLQQARSQTRGFRRKITSEQDLALYHDLWQDRQFREMDTVEPSAPPLSPPSQSLTPGLAVEHTHFGPGIIQAVTPGSSEAEALITIRFATPQPEEAEYKNSKVDQADNEADNEDNKYEERTFMAGLLAGKLTMK